MKELLQREKEKRTALPESMRRDRHDFLAGITSRFPSFARSGRPEKGSHLSLSEHYERASSFERGVYTLERDLQIPEALGISDPTPGDEELQAFLHHRLTAQLADFLNTNPSLVYPDNSQHSLKSYKTTSWHTLYHAHFAHSANRNPALGRIERELDSASDSTMRIVFLSGDYAYYLPGFIKRLEYEEFPKDQIGLLDTHKQGFYARQYRENRIIAGNRERIAQDKSAAQLNYD
jgi:hypothetical protein